LAGATIAGLTWLVWQKICITFQVGISNNNVIYGAFASIPITLYWIYINWVIVLFGAELTFAWQNFRTFSMEIDADDVSPALRRRLCFRIVYDVCRLYRQSKYWNSRQFHEDSRIPIRLLNNILQMLKDRGIIVQLEDDCSWVPGRETKQITMKDIEFAARGAVDGRFEHIGKMPAAVAKILEDHEISYFGDLEGKNFADLLDSDTNLDETELKTI
jgi:membrane protein